MNTMPCSIQELQDTIYGLKVEKGHPIRLSNTRIKVYESCHARYIYSYVLFPRIKTKKAQDIVRRGVAFHRLAEGDFDRDGEKDILSGLNPEEAADVRSWTEEARKAEYLKIPAETEKELECELTDGLSFYGILDRRYVVEPMIIIRDHKTGAVVNYNSDHDQSLAYTFLENRVNATRADRIQVIMDYIKFGRTFEYSFTAEDLDRFENRLRSLGNRIRTTEDEFLTSRSMQKVNHSIGDGCTFCPANGFCLAYQFVINPTCNHTSPKHMMSEEIAAEFYLCHEAAKANEARRDVLKGALLERMKAGESAIEELVTISKRTESIVPTEIALDALFEDWVKKTKVARFADMIDWQRVREEMVPFIRAILPATLRTSKIHASTLKKLEKFVQTVVTPYVRPKG